MLTKVEDVTYHICRKKNNYIYSDGLWRGSA